MAAWMGRVGEVEHAALLYHHPATEGESDAVASALRSEERHEKRLTVLSWYRLSVVADIQEDLVLRKILLVSSLHIHNHLLGISLQGILR